MHGIDPAEVMERNRRYPVVRVRQEVFVRARDDMNMSFSSIGRIMGLDHATAQGSLVFSLIGTTTGEDVAYLLDVFSPIVGRLRAMSPLYTQYLKERGS